MKKEDKISMEELAAQLRTPSGAHGVKVAEMMNESNIEMTKSCCKALGIDSDFKILEIGHGSAAHVDEFFKLYPDLIYHGLELSSLMFEQAQDLNQPWVEKGCACFKHYDGQNLPYEDDTFDGVMTVNTLYFWPSPELMLTEIKRILKTGGNFSLCFAQKKFMHLLPFTFHGFTLYDAEEVVELVQNCGFKNVQYEFGYDRVIRKDDPSKYNDREYVILKAKK